MRAILFALTDISFLGVPVPSSRLSLVNVRPPAFAPSACGAAVGS